MKNLPPFVSIYSFLFRTLYPIMFQFYLKKVSGSRSNQNAIAAAMHLVVLIVMPLVENV